MTTEAVTFSSTPRPTWKEFNDTEKYQCVDYLKIRKELATLQKRISFIASTYGEKNLLPDLRKQA